MQGCCWLALFKAAPVAWSGGQRARFGPRLGVLVAMHVKNWSRGEEWLDCNGKGIRVSQLGKGPKASLAFPTAITPASAEANRKENEEISHRWVSLFKLSQKQKPYLGKKSFQPCPFPPDLLALSLFLYAKMYGQMWGIIAIDYLCFCSFVPGNCGYHQLHP